MFKVPASLALVAGLSCGLTILTSTVYLILSTYILIYRDCTESIDTVQLLPLLYRLYVLDEECQWSIKLNVTEPETVLIFTILTLCMSALLLISAICFVLVIKYKTDLLSTAGYIYVGLTLCSLVVDVTFATHLGIDYSNVVNGIGNEELSEHITIVLQFGIFILMTLSLKGFIIPLLNIIFNIIIIIYLETFREDIKRSQHPIHSNGPLNAYESSMNSSHNLLTSPFQTASDLNNTQFQDSTNNSNTHLSLYSNQPWQNYYLQSPNLSRTPMATSTPQLSQSPWLRQWPEPDYTPQVRRLKSALKTPTR